jgi:hypothetical protein
VADLILQNLAAVLAAANLPGVGKVYDQTDADPTPDVVTARSDGQAQIIFIDPYRGQYDTALQNGKVATFGSGGHVSDESTILVIVLVGPLDLKKIGTLQRKARPFARYLIRDTIRHHSTLNGTVYRARATDFTGGPISWGGVDWYAVQVPVNVADDRQVDADE